MTDDHDIFERELAALRPAPATDELRRRIGARLARRAPGWVRGLAAAAVWVVIGVSAWRVMPTGERAEVAATAPLPTLWRYQAAAARSMDELERVLESDARRLPPVGGPPMRVTF